MTERLAAEYWAERDKPVDADATGDNETTLKLERLYQWVGNDLRDAEAKLEVALAETINELSCTLSVDVGITLLIASAWLDIRRIRNAQALGAAETAHG